MSKEKYSAFHPEDVKDYVSVYWRYYCYLENEYLSIFSTPPSDLYKAVELYLSIGSEIDVMLKTICLILNDKYSGRSIDDHKKEIKKIIDAGDWDDYNQTVSLMSGETIKPWDDSCPVKWWRSYNDVKHKRTLKDNKGNLYFSHATQDNIKYALSALYILEMQYLNFIKESLLFVYPEFDTCKSNLFV